MRIIPRYIILLLVQASISCSGSLTATLEQIPADGKSRGEVVFQRPLLGGDAELQGPSGDEASGACMLRRGGP